jgi:hypothetical protein
LVVEHVFDDRVRDELTPPQTLTVLCVTTPTWPFSDGELVDRLDTVQTLAAVNLHLVREV